MTIFSSVCVLYTFVPRKASPSHSERFAHQMATVVFELFIYQ